jgi:hypothetical protein
MRVTKKQITTTLNIKSKIEMNDEALLNFTEEWEDKEIFNFEVLDNDSDNDYFYYTVLYEETIFM